MFICEGEITLIVPLFLW